MEISNNLVGVKVVHGANDEVFQNISGMSVEQIHRSLADAFGITRDAIAFANGNRVPMNYRVHEGDIVEFCKPCGFKAIGEYVWTGEEFCKLFRISIEDLHSWIAQGLKIKKCLDGTIRITDTSADEFFRGQVIESPYLSTDQAATYCNLTKDAFYSRVERRKITPLPGSGKENRFTKEQCDKMMLGDTAS